MSEEEEKIIECGGMPKPPLTTMGVKEITDQMRALVEAQPYTTEPLVLREEGRSTAVSATEIGKILGVSSRQGPLEVYCIKRGILTEEPGDESAIWGTRLQKEVANAYADSTGLTVEWLDIRHRSKERPWQIGTPDAVAYLPGGLKHITEPRRAGERLVEVKCRASSKGWGEPKTDQVPLETMAQVMWNMDIMGLPVADIVVLFGGMQMKIYTVPYNVLIARDLRAAGESFLKDHVIPGVAPAPQPTREAARALAALYAEPGGEVADATPNEIFYIDALLTLKKSLKQAEKDYEEASLAVKSMVGVRLGLQCDKWRLTWSPVKGRKSIDWEGMYRELVGDPNEDLLKAYTKVGQPYRRLTEKLFNIKEESDD